MSTIKIGDKVVQTTDPSGRIRGGIDSASRLDLNPQRTKSDLKIIQDQAKNIKDITDTFDRFDNKRGMSLALSTPKRLLEEAQERRIQRRRQAQVLDDLRTGKNVDKSEFTGRKPKDGTKNSILTAFGIGTVPTGKPKLREGLSSAEYADFMRQAYQANPGMIESLFPVASGKVLDGLTRFVPGIGTLQNIASAAKTKTGNFLNRAFPGLLNTGIATTNQAAPSLAELNENAFRFGSFRNAPTNIKDIKADNNLDNQIKKRIVVDYYGKDALNFDQSRIDGLYGTIPNEFKADNQKRISDRYDKFKAISLFDSSLDPLRVTPDAILKYDEIVNQSMNPPDIDVSQEGIAPLDAANVLKNEILFGLDNNQTGSTLTGLSNNSNIAQQKNFFENAIRGNSAGLPTNIGQIYQNLLDSGALSSSEALQYGSFVRNLQPPSNTYGLNPNIKPGIESIPTNFPGVL